MKKPPEKSANNPLNFKMITFSNALNFAGTRDIAFVTNITTEIPATEKLRQSQSCLPLLQMEVLQLLKQNPRYVGQYRANTLKPGYTGFIPQRAYRCGSTYGNDAAECMHAFCETNKKVILKNAELRLQITSSPKLKPIVSDQEVTRAIHNYCERREFSLKVSEKEMLEPPKIGWTGYIPKSKVTELGLGDCYHIMTGKCFEAFKTSISGDPQASSRPLNKTIPMDNTQEKNRLYIQSPLLHSMQRDPGKSTLNLNRRENCFRILLWMYLLHMLVDIPG
ncbi:hypothetical protein EOD39_6055 [Acipenser ruthenus]|uniref:Uncharacterized protein n=1 Tax=Acipenser ruthenus TaxID=7906 RepID=A0A444UBS5_ACIRT|nr:hypothetical protein EOD39_6055 [Acipenser ruthenus]